MSAGALITAIVIAAPFAAMAIFIVARLVFAAYFYTRKQYEEKQRGGTQ